MQQRSGRIERSPRGKPQVDPGEAWLFGLVLKAAGMAATTQGGEERRKAQLLIFKIYVATPGLSCDTWGLHLWPDQGSDPRPRALGTQSLGRWTTREVPRLDSIEEEWKEAGPQRVRSGPWASCSASVQGRLADALVTPALQGTRATAGAPGLLWTFTAMLV